MNSIFAFREALGRFYGKHDTIIRLLLKYIIAFGSFQVINMYLNQAVPVNHLLVSAVLAAFCMFLPSNSMILMAAAVSLIHFYAISLEVALAGGAMMIIAMLFYFSIAPESAIPAVLTALSMAGGIPGTIAMCLGLMNGPLSAVGVVYGVFFSRLLYIIKETGGNLQAASADAAEAMVQKMTELMRAVTADREMLVLMAALVLALWIVYLVRKAEIKYAWLVASLAGLLVYAAVRIGAVFFMGISFAALPFVIDCIIGIVVAILAQIFLFGLDYRKTERIQFEDDDFYYYVKAVPKRRSRRRKKVRRGERRR
ncbi:MAG: hypothetical protein ACI4EI_05360 [Muricoprocola sp.]